MRPSCASERKQQIGSITNGAFEAISSTDQLPPNRDQAAEPSLSPVPQAEVFPQQMAAGASSNQEVGPARAGDIETRSQLVVIPVASEMARDARLRVRTEGFNLDAFASTSSNANAALESQSSPAWRA